MLKRNWMKNIIYSFIEHNSFRRKSPTYTRTGPQHPRDKSPPGPARPGPARTPAVRALLLALNCMKWSLLMLVVVDVIRDSLLRLPFAAARSYASHVFILFRSLLPPCLSWNWSRKAANVLH